MTTEEAKAAASSKLSLAKPGCQEKCGNLSIPYPFGIGDEPKCFLNEDFQFFCNTTSDPPQLMMMHSISDDKPILDISLQGQVATTMWAASECYAGEGNDLVVNTSSWELPEPYMLSDTRNRFITVGCDTSGILDGYNGEAFYIGCSSGCLNDTKETLLPCDNGLGCCQSTIPKGITGLNISTESIFNFSYTWNINRCGYAFMCDKDLMASQVSRLWSMGNNVKYLENFGIQTPIILDWAIRNKTCEDVGGMEDNIVCGNNTYCTNSTNGPGYLCHCLQGYQGNPYLPDGCQ
ncbi:PREDICTED: wall-associated receptor kinase 2-like, partial [Nelumbo nucifera]